LDRNSDLTRKSDKDLRIFLCLPCLQFYPHTGLEEYFLLIITSTILVYRADIFFVGWFDCLRTATLGYDLCLLAQIDCFEVFTASAKNRTWPFKHSIKKISWMKECKIDFSAWTHCSMIEQEVESKPFEIDFFFKKKKDARWIFVKYREQIFLCQ